MPVGGSTIGEQTALTLPQFTDSILVTRGAVGSETYYRLTLEKLLNLRPTFACERSGTILVNDNTWQNFFGDTEFFDSMDWYDPVTGRFTPLIAGFYSFRTEAQWSGVGDSVNISAKIEKNATDNFTFNRKVGGAGGNSVGVSGGFVMNGTTDYVIASFLHQNGSAINLGATGLFMGWLDTSTRA